MTQEIGESIHALARELFPICRSITGDGVRQTLRIIQRELPDLKIFEVASGVRCFDWTVPFEWNIRDAYILDPQGHKIVDFKQHNLHVVGYSIPVDQTVSLEELQQHLHSLPELPDAIPYVTSYYLERWGFCLTHRQRERLKPGNYRVRIDSALEPGHLTYGEWILPGESDREIFLSTYVCHPSMGNNELSGPTVTTYLAKWLLGLEKRRYTYRIIFIPETIGSILYVSRNLQQLKERVAAGFNVNCIGDERTYSYLPSRKGDALSDRVAQHVLRHLYPAFKRYSYLDRKSDERQYCSPGVDLPVASVMRSSYWHYPEYHTSKDDLTVITPAGLAGGFEALRLCLMCLERNETLKVSVMCEPQLGRRGLYPTLSIGGGSAGEVFDKVTAYDILNLLAYSDGSLDLLKIADIIGKPFWDLFKIVDALKQEGILECASDETSFSDRL